MLSACVQNVRLPNARMLHIHTYFICHKLSIIEYNIKYNSFESHTPLVNGCVDDVLFNIDPNVEQTLSQFVNISNLCLVDALLHCSPAFVIHRVKIWTVRWPLFR